MPKTTVTEEKATELIKQIVREIRKQFIGDRVGVEKSVRILNLVFKEAPFFDLRAEREPGSERVLILSSESPLGWLSIVSEHNLGLSITYESSITLPLKEGPNKSIVATRVNMELYTIISKAIINEVKIDLMPADARAKDFTEIIIEKATRILLQIV